MSAGAFAVILGVLLGPGLRWSFHHLPEAAWQIMASVPRRADGAGRWQGLNLTLYGFFLAAAGTFGVGVSLLQLAAIGLSIPATVLMAVLLVSVGLPASRYVARWVEHKQSPFTVAEGAFAGLLASPAGAFAAGRLLHTPMPLVPVLAALSVAYLFG